MAQGVRRRHKALLVTLGAAAWVALLGFHGRDFVPAPGAVEAPSRRARLLSAPAALIGAAAALESVNIDEAFADEAPVLGAPYETKKARTPGMDPSMPEVDIPDRVSDDPYGLIGMDPNNIPGPNTKADKREFYMKKAYREDTAQVMKHMKISAALDKGTANMEQWNLRVKEEMDDWMALYRRQDAVIGRQSYYALRSAVNALASHFTSYGPRFPFPNKKRPRFYQKMYLAEKYLDKGK